MRKFTIALAAAGCLAIAAPPVLAGTTMSSTRPSDEARSAPTHQMLAQGTYNSTKKKNDSNTQDQTKRKSWGGG